MDRTVVATSDGSQQSRRILPHASRLAAACRLDLAVIEAIDGSVERATQPENAELAIAARRLNTERELAATLHAVGIHAEAHAIEAAAGHQTARAVVAEACNQGAVLLAMSSRGRGVLRETLLGSTTLRVLSASHMPVMVGGARLGEPRHAEQYRILACTDGSPEAEAIGRSMTALLLESDVRVSVVRVDEGVGIVTHAARERLERWLPGDAAGESPVARARSGNIPADIVDIAAELDVDAIALATHGFKFARRILRGSVALAVLERSPVPVILAH